MKVIYIAGPYRDTRGEWWVRENIRNAEVAALAVWEAGGVALCPHLNTAFFGGCPGTTDEMWLKGDLELLRRCDAVYARPGWTRSKGSVGEIKHAEFLNKPVFFWFFQVKEFLNES